MRCVNTITLLGNVTKDAEMKTLQTGHTLCTFDLATNREWKDGEGKKKKLSEFHHCIVWGKLAEFCHTHVKKGKPVYVQGHVRTHTWENAQKVPMHRTEVVVDSLSLLGPRDKSPEASDVPEEEAVAA